MTKWGANSDGFWVIYTFEQLMPSSVELRTRLPCKCVAMNPNREGPALIVHGVAIRNRWVALQLACSAPELEAGCDSTLTWKEVVTICAGIVCVVARRHPAIKEAKVQEAEHRIGESEKRAVRADIVSPRLRGWRLRQRF